MRRGRLAGAVLVALFMVTGCSDPQNPPTTTPASPSASPSPSPTPSPTPPPTPDASVPPERPDLSEVNAETAEALAVYFLRLFPYAAATGDLADWSQLSHPECTFCSSVRSDIEAIFAAGHHSEGGLLHVEEVGTAEVSDSWWLVTVRLVQNPSETKDSRGEVVETFPETKRMRLDVAVTLHDGHLTVREVDTTREG